ncbi:hypothetical protein [Acidianus sp. HS-5]|uniref:hypothetical protein n=1 Tax=Acidianus sp. HS-5 TaxID=2886040 RepID=UPI001F1BDD6F|nr:hypothetical protein [Acidianus sp. HS-5]BDC17571.1 hypothetical protein HS5_04610 [Acidianus sp. HS-5]
MIKLKNFVREHNRVLCSLSNILTEDPDVFAILEFENMTGRPIIYDIGPVTAYLWRVRRKTGFTNYSPLGLQYLSRTIILSRFLGLLSVTLSLIMGRTTPLFLCPRYSLITKMEKQFTDTTS